MRLATDFMWPAIFAVNIKTQLHGFFYCKDKNPAMLLTLVLALLLRKLRKDNRDFSLLVQQFDLPHPPSPVSFFISSHLSYKQPLREEVLKKAILKQKSFPQFFALFHLFSQSSINEVEFLAIKFPYYCSYYLHQLLNVNGNVCFKCLNVFFCSSATLCLCVRGVLLSIDFAITNLQEWHPLLEGL